MPKSRSRSRSRGRRRSRSKSRDRSRRDRSRGRNRGRGRRSRSRSNSIDSEDEREKRRRKAREANKKWDAPPGSVPGAAPTLQFGAAGQYVDRRARRVYVGGLQPNVQEIDLRQFFDKCLLASPDRTSPPSVPPVMSVSLHRKPETNALFAFIEFATADDADMGLCMDGVQFQGNNVVIRRPKDFVPAVGREPRSYNIPVMGGSVNIGGVSSKVDDGPDKLFVGSLPTSMSATEVQALLSTFGDLKSFNLVMTPQLQSRGFAFFRYRDPACTLPAVKGLNGLEVMGNRLSCELCQCPKPSDATAMIDQLLSPQFLADPRLFQTMNSMNQPASILVAGAKPPTNVICLSNMVTKEDIESQEDYEEILDDVKQEMSGFGIVKNVFIPRPNSNNPSHLAEVGKIYVEFETLENAWTASQAIQGRKFNDRVIGSEYISPEVYKTLLT